MSKDRFVVELVRDPGHKLSDLGPIADVLVMLCSEPILVAALNLAHDINATRLMKQSQRQIIEDVADDLRTKLAQAEEQMRRLGD